MGVRSKRLWGPTTVGNAATILYTCAAGETTLLKCLTGSHSQVPNTVFRLFLGVEDPANEILSLSVGTTSGLLQTNLFIVLQPLQQFRALTVGGTLHIAGFGAQLEGVAD